MLVVAPTQTRKTTSLVIPNLLTWPGPAIVYDPKGELWDQTAGYRSQVQRCYYWNPLATQTHQRNLLDAVRVGTVYAIRDVLQIAEGLVTAQGGAYQDGRTDSVHWNEKARKVLAGSCLHLLHEQDAAYPPTLGGVAQFLSLPFQSVLQDMADASDAFVAACGRDGLDLKGEEASSVQSTVRRVLDPFLEPLIAQATARSDFDFRQMRADGGQTVYLSTPLSDRLRLRPLLRLLLESFFTTWTEALPPVVRPAERILVVLDEFPSLGRLSLLSENLGFVAGYGLRCMLIAPTWTSLEEVYGVRNSLWAQSHVRVVFAPNEAREADKIVHELGRETVEVTSETRPQRPGVAGAIQRGTSTSTHPMGRPLLHSDEVQRLPMTKSIVFMGRQSPILATKINLRKRGWQRLWVPVPVVPIPGERHTLARSPDVA
jgi:type IV secretion system protein VirD4